MACTLVPDMPYDDTAARRGVASVWPVHDVTYRGTSPLGVCSRAIRAACRSTTYRICWAPPSGRLMIGQGVNSQYCAGMSDGGARTP
jgi:hypothetical protein